MAANNLPKNTDRNTQKIQLSPEEAAGLIETRKLIRRIVIKTGKLLAYDGVGSRHDFLFEHGGRFFRIQPHSINILTADAAKDLYEILPAKPALRRGI
jgi:hypothetical protein